MDHKRKDPCAGGCILSAYSTGGHARLRDERPLLSIRETWAAAALCLTLALALLAIESWGAAPARRLAAARGGNIHPLLAPLPLPSGPQLSLNTGLR